MATFSDSTNGKGNDWVQDFLCSACEDKKLEQSADYYCDSCVKFFCRKCIQMHSQLFTKHSPHGRGDMKKWPVVKKVEDFLLKCDVHKEENLASFCKDHSKLCCNTCAFHNHRQCETVMLLTDMVKNTSTDLKQVLVTIQTTLAELRKLQDNQEASIQSVQSSYDEQLHKIQETRQKILAALDMLEKKTLQEMKDTLTKLQASLKSDVDKCSTLGNELNQLRDAFQDISDKSKQELSFIASIKCKDIIQQFENYQKQNFAQLKFSITFHPNSEIMQYLSQLSGLGKIEHYAQSLTAVGNADQIIRIDGESEYDVWEQGDEACGIRDICVLPSGQVLVVDQYNKKVKLLNKQYQVVSHCSVSDKPGGMCQITPSEVGVTVGSEVKFIKVNNNQLVQVRKLKFQHDCLGIASHQGDLFVTSGTELYNYSLDGKLVSKLHENKSHTRTVWGCAVSPTGDKLYITNYKQDKLLTLARDGSVLSIFKDPELLGPRCVHVTPAGQVLVCGWVSDTILQIDSKGSRKLATLATEMYSLRSVCYNSNTDSIIVGSVNNKILVYKVK
ncbi:uncharacterized protein LOC127836932 [Dreissena polymorpha]|uniref:B box-type domain-containing protein n=1 Tax=Dreissena polymorpha TaxID=45954 RepID=A0A9D4J2Z7_DREPO|nr:uncharacterized protein LOC127836932 [Dreissena polymorpha]KAH3796475.1 hypothetical protein DPMN_150043 [Dreissena polymorpha]